MTYSHPEQLRKIAVDGKEITERVPGSPTRPARDFELNVWWEEVDGDGGYEQSKQQYLARKASGDD